MAKWPFLPWRQSSASKYRPDTLNYGCISTSKSGEFSVGDANNKAVPVMPVGCVIPFAGAAAPTGWLLCQGQAISRTTYAQLFSVIGTTYGSGDGKTTFNLPDMRGRVAVGSDANLGQKVGAKSVSFDQERKRDAILTCSLWTMGSMMVPIEVRMFGRTMGDLTQIVHITVPTPERAQP